MALGVFFGRFLGGFVLAVAGPSSSLLPLFCVFLPLVFSLSVYFWGFRGSSVYWVRGFSRLGVVILFYGLFLFFTSALRASVRFVTLFFVTMPRSPAVSRAGSLPAFLLSSYLAPFSLFPLFLPVFLFGRHCVGVLVAVGVGFTPPFCHIIMFM